MLGIASWACEIWSAVSQAAIQQLAGWACELSCRSKPGSLSMMEQAGAAVLFTIFNYVIECC